MKKLFREIKDDANFIKSHTLQPKWYKIFKVFLILGFLGGHLHLFGPLKTIVFSGVFFFFESAGSSGLPDKNE